MKKQYTRKQIQEAINYWSNKLKMINENTSTNQLVHEIEVMLNSLNSKFQKVNVKYKKADMFTHENSINIYITRYTSSTVYTANSSYYFNSISMHTDGTINKYYDNKTYQDSISNYGITKNYDSIKDVKSNFLRGVCEDYLDDILLLCQDCPDVKYIRICWDFQSNTDNRHGIHEDFSKYKIGPTKEEWNTIDKQTSWR